MLLRPHGFLEIIYATVYVAIESLKNNNTHF
jgi:hypothetical protein